MRLAHVRSTQQVTYEKTALSPNNEFEPGLRDDLYDSNVYRTPISSRMRSITAMLPRLATNGIT